MSQEVYVKEKLKLIFSCVLILICLPYFVTYCFQGEPAKATVKTDESIEIAGILASLHLHGKILRQQGTLL